MEEHISDSVLVRIWTEYPAVCFLIIVAAVAVIEIIRIYWTPQIPSGIPLVHY